MQPGRRELVLKLVETCHLNVKERALLRPATITTHEITEAIATILERSDFYPENARSVCEGDHVTEAIYEGLFIERRAGTYTVHSQACGPHPFAFRGRSEQRFETLADAVAYLLAKEYGGEIDGIRIRDAYL